MRELLQQKAVTAASSSTNGLLSNVKMRCVNVGYDGTADASTSYLCPDCFEWQHCDEMGAAAASIGVAATTLTSSSSRYGPSSTTATVTTITSTNFNRYGSSVVAREMTVNVGGGYIVSSGAAAVNGRGQYSEHNLERDLDELQRSRD